jgi:hypothetical protein
VSLFRSFLIFASKQNVAKRILFSFVFTCFCETKKKISLHFASFHFDAFSLFRFNLFSSNKILFFRYFASTFSLQNMFFAISLRIFCFITLFFAISLKLFCFKTLFLLLCFYFFASNQCCRSGSGQIRTKKVWK